LRLKNGNTLISTGNGHGVIEVTPAKKIVWHLKQNDLPGISLAWVTTLQVLPNGNYVLGNCHAGNDNPQIIEVNKSKKVMWTFKDFTRFGNATANFQIIDAKLDLSFYEKKVHPILEKNCFKCHGHSEEKMKGGLWLASRMNILKGGDVGAIVNLQTPQDSSLLKYINHVDEEHEMPPKKKLSESDIAILTEWVYKGVPYAPSLEDILVQKNEINEITKNFWSFLPIKNVTPPKVQDTTFISNEIDNFIQVKREKANFQHAPQADKITLIRRAYYDLIGLPPTPRQIELFVQNKDPKAWENLIDKLLASQQYGERWGRHWLDVVRFAETNGYERDGAKPQAWKYRQWVIDSFNKDKPYKQMVKEQLAGDELDKVTTETITATGYIRLGLFDDEPADKLQAIYDEYDDTVRTTAEVFMGLTVGCARCHSHKIDPIPMGDYYSMLSFFHNVKPTSRRHHENSILRNVISPAKKAELVRKNKPHHDLRLSIQKDIKAIERQFAIAFNKQNEKKVALSDLHDLRYRYYRSTWNALPDFDMIKAEREGTVDYNWFDISIADRVNSFGFVFEGKINVPKDGRYTFFLNSDDGSRLAIDGKRILEYDGIHGMDKERKTSLILKAGDHSIRLDYFQRLEGKGLSVAWQGPNMSRRSLSKPPKVLNFMKHFKQSAPQLLTKNILKQYYKLQKLLEQKKEIPAVEYVLAAQEYPTTPKPTHILMRGSAHAKGPQVEPQFLSILGAEKPSITPRKNSSGRRRAFADWLVRDTNPLTARVIVNRIWQYHFGRGIVTTPNNFGMMGDAPTHPKLLDFLSYKFIQDGWSFKKMHKYIMLSSSYRMSSKVNAKALAGDPQNKLFWRFNMRRLSAEEIRDSILSVNGKLDLTYGGQSVYPKISREVLEGQSKITWKVKTGPEHQSRRSIYTFVKRSLALPLIESFDGATTDSSCAVRFQTTQPTQALSILNSELINEAAAILAERLKRDVGADFDKQVARAFHLVTGHQANAKQLAAAREFRHQMKLLNTNDQTTMQQFCLIILNLNQFIYLD